MTNSTMKSAGSDDRRHCWALEPESCIESNLLKRNLERTVISPWHRWTTESCLWGFAWMLMLPVGAAAQAALPQQVEGFDSVVFKHETGIISSTVDFRGPSPGHMTATWTAPGQMKNNIVVWKTAVVPEKKRTTLSFIGSSSPKPPEFSQGPRARLFVNDHYVLTFGLGIFRDKSWKEGEAELKYLSRRVEWPYYGSHRNFELNGNSGIYLLTLPPSLVEAGKPCTIKVEVLPFPTWPKAWFMVKERRDTLQQTDRSLAEQVEQLQREVNRLGQLTHVLATEKYNKLLVLLC